MENEAEAVAAAVGPAEASAEVILPCPFCSADPVCADLGGWEVYCPSCGAAGPTVFAGTANETHLRADAILTWNRRVQAWTSVAKGLPEPETDVLCFGVRKVDRAGLIFTAGLFDGRWMSAETQTYCVFEVTHWAPLPRWPNVPMR